MRHAISAFISRAVKILIVDSDNADRITIQSALGRTAIPVDVSEVSRCADALSRLQTQHYDCILLEYQLPDGDGLSLIQKCRTVGVKVPLIVLTDKGDEQIAVSLMKAGASDYLPKSRLTPETLARCLHNALRLHWAEYNAEQAQKELQAANVLLRQKNQELERSQQQIQRQNLELIRASRLKSQFLATMSHELRTPMNAILGFSQILLRQTKGPLNAYQVDMVQRVFTNGKNLLTLLNDILEFSKLESGRLDLQPEEINVIDLVSATVENLRSLAESKSIALEASLDLPQPLVVNDPARLQQVMTNLISNAIKFTDQGTVRVSVTALDADHITMTVSDTGIGIAPDDLEYIFDAFHQADQSAHRRYAGTGLGLAIVHVLVKIMGGRVAVHSTLGQGTTFQIDLPRQVSTTSPTSVLL